MSWQARPRTRRSERGRRARGGGGAPAKRSPRLLDVLPHLIQQCLRVAVAGVRPLLKLSLRQAGRAGARAAGKAAGLAAGGRRAVKTGGRGRQSGLCCRRGGARSQGSLVAAAAAYQLVRVGLRELVADVGRHGCCPLAGPPRLIRNDARAVVQCLTGLRTGIDRGVGSAGARAASGEVNAGNPEALTPPSPVSASSRAAGGCLTRCKLPQAPRSAVPRALPAGARADRAPLLRAASRLKPRRHHCQVGLCSCRLQALPRQRAQPMYRTLGAHAPLDRPSPALLGVWAANPGPAPGR